MGRRDESGESGGKKQGDSHGESMSVGTRGGDCRDRRDDGTGGNPPLNKNKDHELAK